MDNQIVKYYNNVKQDFRKNIYFYVFLFITSKV